MITVITGAPGTGKSALLVSLLAMLGKERAVFISGIGGLQIEHEVLEDPTQWHQTVPDGSVVVVDEVQRVWRPRGPGSKVPAEIAALETHRHRGLDFYLITQSPRLIDSNVRGLVGRHIHLRDLGILGRWWYEWPECADNCATGWKNAPIKKRYSLPKAVFGQYKSASVHIKPIRSIPWMLAVMVLALLVTGFMSWRGYVAISSKLAPPAVQQPVKSIDSITAKAHAQAGPAAAAASAPVFDSTAFVPRLSSKPETAPAYDHLRVVVAMPMVAGAICNARRCVCVTQQGSSAGLSDGECRSWLNDQPFNPYMGVVANAGVPSAVAGTPLGYTQPAAGQPVDQVALTVIPDSRGSGASSVASQPRTTRPPAPLP